MITVQNANYSSSSSFSRQSIYHNNLSEMKLRGYICFLFVVIVVVYFGVPSLMRRYENMWYIQLVRQKVNKGDYFDWSPFSVVPVEPIFEYCNLYSDRLRDNVTVFPFHRTQSKRDHLYSESETPPTVSDRSWPTVKFYKLTCTPRIISSKK